MAQARSTTHKKSLVSTRQTYPSTWAAGRNTKPSRAVRNPAMKFQEARGMHRRLVSGATVEKTPK